MLGIVITRLGEKLSTHTIKMTAWVVGRARLRSSMGGGGREGGRGEVENELLYMSV